MCVNAQGLDDSFMVLSSLLLLLGRLRNGALMPLGLCQELRQAREYIIVGVDYMTRWAEATPTSRITAKDVAKFVLTTSAVGLVHLWRSFLIEDLGLEGI